MLADLFECFLVFRRGAVFQPEQAKWLQRLAELRGFVRGVAVVPVVQQMMIEAIGFAQLLEQLGHMVQCFGGIPASDRRQFGIGWLVVERATPHAIGILDAGHAALRANCLVAHVDIATDRVDRL